MATTVRVTMMMLLMVVMYCPSSQSGQKLIVQYWLSSSMYMHSGSSLLLLLSLASLSVMRSFFCTVAGERISLPSAARMGRAARLAKFSTARSRCLVVRAFVERKMHSLGTGVRFDRISGSRTSRAQRLSHTRQAARYIRGGIGRNYGARRRRSFFIERKVRMHWSVVVWDRLGATRVSLPTPPADLRAPRQCRNARKDPGQRGAVRRPHAKSYRRAVGRGTAHNLQLLLLVFDLGPVSQA